MGALGTVAIAFVSGSVGAVFVNAIARYWIFQPVISIQLNRAVGSAYKTRVPPEVAEGDEKEGQFFSNGIRLRIENTGFLTLKDCRGFVTRMRRLKAGQTVKSRARRLSNSVGLIRGKAELADISWRSILSHGRGVGVSKKSWSSSAYPAPSFHPRRIYIASR